MGRYYPIPLLVLVLLIGGVEAAASQDNTAPYIYLHGKEMRKEMTVEYGQELELEFEVLDVERDPVNFSVEIYLMSISNVGFAERMLGPDDEMYGNWTIEEITEVSRVLYDERLCEWGIPRSRGLYRETFAHEPNYYVIETFHRMVVNVRDGSIFSGVDDNITNRDLLFVINVDDGRGGRNFISKVVTVQREVDERVDPPSFEDEDSGIVIGPPPGSESEPTTIIHDDDHTDDNGVPRYFLAFIILLSALSTIFISAGIVLFINSRRSDR